MLAFCEKQTRLRDSPSSLHAIRDNYAELWPHGELFQEVPKLRKRKGKGRSRAREMEAKQQEVKPKH